MTKARQLRDVKGAEAHERQVLAHKLQASEQARVALEEVSKAREALLQASEQGRRDRDASMLIRDRDASACVAAGNRAAADLVEAKEAESKARAASSALEQRVAALAEESKQLKAQRDTLEEQSEASQVGDLLVIVVEKALFVFLLSRLSKCIFLVHKLSLNCLNFLRVRTSRSFLFTA